MGSIQTSFDSSEEEVLRVRLERLRAFAQQDLPVAQREMWAWVIEAGSRAMADRSLALAELDALFHAGSARFQLDGPTQGALVATTMHPAADRMIAGLTQTWMPWLGKTFDSANQAGRNLLQKNAHWPTKFLWPRYQMQVKSRNLVAFDFKTYVEASKVDGGQEVLVLDYETVPTNPAFVIQRVRDELVELISGVYLGKILWRQRSKQYPLIGYFALKVK